MIFQSHDFELHFDDASGAWKALLFRGQTIFSGAQEHGFELEIEGATPTVQLVAHRQEDLPDRARLTCEYSCEASDGASRYAVFQTFDVSEDPPRLERALRLERRAAATRDDAAPQALRSATLRVAGLMAGDADATRVSVPMARALPAMPLRQALKRPRVFDKPADKQPSGDFFPLQNTPDIFPGTVCLENPAAPLFVALTPLPRQCPVSVRLYGQEESLIVEQCFACESRLWLGDGLEVARQVFQCAPQAWDKALPAVGEELARRGFAPPDDRPAWARDAIILEADLKFSGGLNNLRARLDEFQQIGFNTIYLMPWHRGGYATQRYDEIDPALGSFAELRALCDAAHARGLRVLFDLLVNIAGEGSPYPAEHPDWFYRDASGAALRHSTWGGSCLDPASPGFRRFFLDYAVRCCTQWGADGFRVDAVAYRGGNWNPLPELQPHQHAHAVFTLIDEVRHAIRRANPNAICLAECFGPAQVPISDLVCLQWISWLDWALQRVLDGRLDGGALSRLLGEHFAAMPPGTWFAGYTHTHDTVAFEKRDLQGAPVDALFATLTLLCAATMTFGGGWRMRERPSPAEIEEYRALFAAKRRLGGVTGSAVKFCETDDPALLMARRPAKGGDVHVVTNFSDQSRTLPFEPLRLEYSRLGSDGCCIAPYDTLVTRLN